MHDFHLTILSHDDKQVTYKYSAEGSSLPLINEISLTSPADGRYIMIRLLGESRQLSLCGVDVFGGKRLSYIFIMICSNEEVH